MSKHIEFIVARHVNVRERGVARGYLLFYGSVGRDMLVELGKLPVEGSPRSAVSAAAGALRAFVLPSETVSSSTLARFKPVEDSRFWCGEFGFDEAAASLAVQAPAPAPEVEQELPAAEPEQVASPVAEQLADLVADDEDEDMLADIDAME